MSIVIMILLLSFLVLVHEAGHFFAARWLGIKVSKFGFGLPIGPILYSKKVGDVDVVVHAFLLGGYVSFPDDEKDSGIPLDSEERFMNKPVWQRMIVISAGVIANIITAFVFVLITAFAWGQLPSGDVEVFVHKVKSESAIQAGLVAGDKVLKINDSIITNPNAFTIYCQKSKRYDGLVNKEFVEENFEKLVKLNKNMTKDSPIPENELVILPKSSDESELHISDDMLKGFMRYKDNQVELSDVQVKLRDKIQGQTQYISDGAVTLEDIAYAISDTKRPMILTVLRDGNEIVLSPAYSDEKGVLGVELSSKQIMMKTKGFIPAIKGSFKYLWDQTYMLVYGLWMLFSGKIPMQDLHGIVVITKIGGDVIQNSGFFSGLLLTAMISLDLALVNFLPIPALDGGHFMFLIIEKLRGKPLDEDTVNKISSFFFLLLILFMVFVVFNDIYALIKHKF